MCALSDRWKRNETEATAGQREKETRFTIVVSIYPNIYDSKVLFLQVKKFL